MPAAGSFPFFKVAIIFLKNALKKPSHRKCDSFNDYIRVRFHNFAEISARRAQK